MRTTGTLLRSRTIAWQRLGSFVRFTMGVLSLVRPERSAKERNHQLVSLMDRIGHRIVLEKKGHDMMKLG